MAGVGDLVKLENVRLGSLRRTRVIARTAGDNSLGSRQQSSRVTRDHGRDAQRGAARRGTAAWFGMPSMRMRILRLQHAVRTLIPPFVRGDAEDGGGGGGGGDDDDDDQLAERMADLDV